MNKKKILIIIIFIVILLIYGVIVTMNKNKKLQENLNNKSNDIELTYIMQASKKIEEVMAYNQSYIDKVGGLTEAFETLERGKKYLDKELLTKKQLKVLSDNLEAAKKFYNS